MSAQLAKLKPHTKLHDLKNGQLLQLAIGRVAALEDDTKDVRTKHECDRLLHLLETLKERYSFKEIKNHI